MNSIILSLDGGLGNQLFQYAAGYALSKKLGLPLELDLTFYKTKLDPAVTPRNFLLDGFNLFYTEMNPADMALVNNNYMMNKLNRIKNRLLPVLETDVYRQPFFYYDEKFGEISKPCRLYGTFQSERYFLGYGSDVRSAFSWKRPLSKVALQGFEKINSQQLPISLHVRRGDLVQKSSTNAYHGTTSLDYYKRSVDLMQKIHGDNAHFFIFSDDIAYVTEAFASLNNKTIIAGDVDYPQEDVVLMSRCHHHIIANSSFSWWGAWLNERADKTVIAPRWWFARETLKTQNTMDLIPEGWLIT